MNSYPFAHDEALQLWARLVAGWAHSLNADGTRTHLDGFPNHADRGGSYEGVTRMLWGLGGWLSQPDRPASIVHAGETFELETLTRRTLVNGCDPIVPTYWGQATIRSAYDQRTVESGQIAIALWQTRHRIWDRLSERQSRTSRIF
jgi:hypothetical protein